LKLDLRQGIVLFIVALLFLGCAKIQKPSKTLEELLVELGASKQEASLISQNAYMQTKILKTKYGVNLHPILHNTLVNLGLKSRGLCWHYAHDLYDALAPLVVNLDAVIVVANLGSWLREHSALVLTCKGCEIDKGVVLDAWRDKDSLIYIPVKQDVYSWRRR
jgi:hypothetical protein